MRFATLIALSVSEMLIDLVQHISIPIRGVVHVGAHLAEENSEYMKLTNRVVWIEANPTLVTMMKDRGS